MTQSPFAAWKFVRRLVGPVVALAVATGAIAATVPSAPAPSAEELRRWIGDLANGNFEVRELATEHLSAAGDAALIALSKAVKSEDPEVAHRAWDIIDGWAAEGNVASLLYQLTCPIASVRAAAAEALGRQEAKAQLALPALLTATQDETIFVRSAAQDAMKKIQATLSLRLDVTAVVEPNEVGSIAVYRLELTNQGDQSYTNVSLHTQVPGLLEVTHVEGSGPTHVENGVIVSDPQTLETGHSLRWDVQVKPKQAGESRLKVELSADGLIAPIHREETAQISPPRPTPAGN